MTVDVDAVAAVIERDRARHVDTGPVELVLYLQPDRSWPPIDLGLPRMAGRPVVDTDPL